MDVYVLTPPKPSVLYRYTGFDVLFPSPQKGVPTVDSTMLGTFWTNDVFSAENPFWEEISMATNTTNLLNYYCCLVLFDEGAEPYYLPLYPASNNTNNEEYEAPIRLIQFNLSGTVHYVLVDRPLIFERYSSFPHNATVPLTLADASTFFSIQFQRTTTRLTWIVIAFGIFLLQPIAESLWGIDAPEFDRRQGRSKTGGYVRWWWRTRWWEIRDRIRRRRTSRR
jgi:hypothetical protein